MCVHMINFYTCLNPLKLPVLLYHLEKFPLLESEYTYPSFKMQRWKVLNEF